MEVAGIPPLGTHFRRSDEVLEEPVADCERLIREPESVPSILDLGRDGTNVPVRSDEVQRQAISRWIVPSAVQAQSIQLVIWKLAVQWTILQNRYSK